ncbi:hypothetical protein [Streptacidiphilus sp. EB129]|uniref:hypothetical protein n=1 Tax=Streptacidiphilus sp. EB129 TaxID=3156262 RepID=UPI003515F7F8
MSARAARFARTAVVTVVAAVTGAVAFLPGAAQAATASSAPASPITLKVGSASPAGAFMPGGATKTITVTASNTSGKAARFTANLNGMADGALGLTERDYTFKVAPVHAPATSGVLFTQDGELMGSFYPKGGHFGNSFTIPAHTSYTWKLTLGITKNWPANDDALRLTVGANGYQTVKALAFTVGHRRTGGPVTERFTGGTTIAPGRPAYETLTVTNRTGAALNGPVDFWLDEAPFGGPATAVDVWKGGRWVAVRDGGELAVLNHGLANGAHVDYRLRVRETGAVKAGTKVTIEAVAGIANRGPISYGDLHLTARR